MSWRIHRYQSLWSSTETGSLFGAEYIESALAASNRKVVIVNDSDEGRPSARHNRCPHLVLRSTVWEADGKEQSEESPGGD